MPRLKAQYRGGDACKKEVDYRKKKGHGAEGGEHARADYTRGRGGDEQDQEQGTVEGARGGDARKKEVDYRNKETDE